MINEAITKILKTYTPRVYSPAVTGDAMPASPFLVYQNELSETHKTKEGIVGYSWGVDITVLSNTASECESIAVSIIESLDANEGDITIGDDTIKLEEITYTDESGREYDEEVKLHANTLQFIIESDRR